MPIALPAPISAYFAADAADGGSVAACFTPDAVVIDEKQTHHGREAISRWKAETSTRYRYVAEPVAIEADGDAQIVTAHLTGDFPGSPIDLRYAFTLADGEIARLEIGV
ncbi:MAG: polyketide cyclase [Sphingobium sp.]|nr:MAG: polyketide cyclase [Sphingobium sp.]